MRLPSGEQSRSFSSVTSPFDTPVGVTIKSPEGRRPDTFPSKAATRPFSCSARQARAIWRLSSYSVMGSVTAPTF